MTVKCTFITATYMDAIFKLNITFTSNSEGNTSPPVKTEPYEVNLPYSRSQWMYGGGQLTAYYLTMISASLMAS